MIKLAVFDWNGTLIADVSACLEATNRELAIVDFGPITIEEFRKHFDQPAIHYFTNLGVDIKKLEDRHLEVANAFHAFYEARVARVRTRHGARSMLDSLAKAGITCVILSNHTMEGIYLQLERLKLKNYFSGVLANEAPGQNYRKNKEERLKDYLAINHFRPSDTLIIGDTVEEVRIGRNLGLMTISITDGYNSTSRLKAVRPDVLINKLPDIVDKIKGF